MELAGQKSTTLFKMAQNFPWLACQADPPGVSGELREKLKEAHQQMIIDCGFMTGTSKPISRFHARSSKGAFGSGLPDPGRKFGGAPQPQVIAGTRGCIGLHLPGSENSMTHRQATANLGGDN